jgi:type IV pilus assembly protein PilB
MKTIEQLLDELEQLACTSRSDLEKRLNRCGTDLFGFIVELARDFPVQRRDIGQIWGSFTGKAYVVLETSVIDEQAVEKLPRELAEKWQVVPTYEIDGVITMVTPHPDDLELESDIMNRLGIVPSLVFGFPDEVSDMIEIVYQTRESLDSILNHFNPEPFVSSDDTISIQQLQALAGDDYVIEFVRGLFLLAIGEGASDIHIEPEEFNIRIRFRIDGVLQQRFVLEKEMQNAIISRIKILANCDIAERRLPQDGRICVEMRYRTIDLRFSAVPTIYGEKLVLRILGQARHKGVPDLEKLDFSAQVLESIKRVSSAPNGVFFVTGPTGSGKTTTLYSILKSINSDGINIMTIEDPVEYRLKGINQVQVHDAIHLDFAQALRAFLRQDPDVILIGEIRDIHSAKIASQAALTGHLVLATMHTNNALQAVNRMIEIGVEPFLVAPSLIAVMAQRLVRRICPKCKEKYPAPPEFLDQHFIWEGSPEVYLYRGKGCEHCHGTGYAGRLGIHEIFILTPSVREMISQHSSVLDIERCAREAGFKPLRYDGLKKVLRGMTTLEEVDRVTAADLA